MMIFLSSCAGKTPEILRVKMIRDEKETIFIEKLIDSMDIEKQISQLFILRFDGNLPSDELKGFITRSKAGGYILFRDNITTIERTKLMTDAIAAASWISPFICIDEEGGVVSRVPGYTPSAQEIGKTGNAQNAYLAGEAIGRTLFSIGVNVDFAPVADILTNPQNKVIGTRAYGNEPAIVSDMVSAFQAGLHSQGIMSAPKHFPGHGNTTGDSHFNIAIIGSNLESLAANEYKPFIRAIGEGAEFIMIGHLLAPGIEPKGLPATLSGYFITDVLRKELKFGGIVVTDAMNMGAIIENYTPDKAAVMAFTAGVDMILMPEDYNTAVDGILKAIRDGIISNERIHESLMRIFKTKIRSGLITFPD
jgi:beta-N-acetylhexosaminidase